MKQALYWKLTFFRDRDIPVWLRDIIDWIRYELLWESDETE